MIDVSELIDDPDFASEFTVFRDSGSFVEGEWVKNAPSQLPMIGVVQPATSEDMLRFLPEGERQKNVIRIWCRQKIQMANGKDEQSDVVVWNCDYHRVAYSKPWGKNGYWFAIAVGFVNG